MTEGPGSQVGASRKKPLPLLLGGVLDHGLEELAGDPERQIALELATAGGANEKPAVAGERGGRAEEGGLPDARRTLDQERRSRSVAKTIERTVE